MVIQVQALKIVLLRLIAHRSDNKESLSMFFIKKWIKRYLLFFYKTLKMRQPCTEFPYLTNCSINMMQIIVHTNTVFNSCSVFPSCLFDNLKKKYFCVSQSIALQKLGYQHPQRYHRACISQTIQDYCAWLMCSSSHFNTFSKVVMSPSLVSSEKIYVFLTCKSPKVQNFIN